MMSRRGARISTALARSSWLACRGWLPRGRPPVLVKNLIDGPFRSFDAGWGHELSASGATASGNWLGSGDRHGGPQPHLGHHAPAAGVRPPTHAQAGISRGPEPALSGRDGARSGQGVQSPPPTDVPPTSARQGQRVRTDGKAGYGTGLIGLKNLRAWSQLLEGRISGNGGAAPRLEDLRRSRQAKSGRGGRHVS